MTQIKHPAMLLVLIMVLKKFSFLIGFPSAGGKGGVQSPKHFAMQPHRFAALSNIILLQRALFWGEVAVEPGFLAQSTFASVLYNEASCCIVTSLNFICLVFPNPRDPILTGRLMWENWFSVCGWREGRVTCWRSWTSQFSVAWGTAIKSVFHHCKWS